MWAKHQTITDAEHAAAGQLLRHRRGELLRPVTDAGTADEDVEVRSLEVYDQALGLVDGEVS